MGWTMVWLYLAAAAALVCFGSKSSSKIPYVVGVTMLLSLAALGDVA